ncbi:unnamed protein product [Clonostachys rosea]|uniref:Uncharacterized protein n=1 Tax=Bionectria ochroleuca TaxID=29856 RepID=A0ABY6UAP7_BIOOC|nr:unnamed protein product [Clonostachys rosea]
MGDNVPPYLEPVMASCWLPAVRVRSLQRLERAIQRSVPIRDMFIDDDGLLCWRGYQGNVVQNQASLIVRLVLARIGEEGGEMNNVSFGVIARRGNERLLLAESQGVHPHQLTIGDDLLPEWPAVVLPPILPPPWLPSVA